MNQAILHIDGDSFFASCEVSLDHTLRGKPVVTGQERGIATAMSKEAKAIGIHRGMPVFKIRKEYPQVVIVNSNYHHYSIFAQRMYEIVRRYSHAVEEYSIDECFAVLEGNSVDKARRIKADLQRELGMTFSLGIAPTKTLAKVASKWNKPDGFTVLAHSDIEKFLEKMEVGRIWGIGPATSQALQRMGVKTALDYIHRSEDWIRENLSKPHVALWHELRGTPARHVHDELEDDQASIQKTRTFSPPSTDKKFLLSELSKNVESACQKARGTGLATRRIYYFLKTQEFRYHRFEIPLTQPTQAPNIIIKEIMRTFDMVYRGKTQYRASGVTLSELVPEGLVQNDLFGEVVEKEKIGKIFKITDAIDRRYGLHTMMLASSLSAYKRRGYRPERHLKIPFLGEVV